MLRPSLLALALTTCLSAPAAANGLIAEQRVEVAEISVDEAGLETKTFVLADEIAPGDEVRYVIFYENQGDADVEDVQLVMPVPAEVDLIEGSVQGTDAEITYSVDNGATFAERGTLTVKMNGETRSARAEDITHVRWTLSQPIAPAADGLLSYRGVLR